MQHIYAKARAIRLAIFDVDGVLTDGALYLSDSGAEIKSFDARDGHGLKMLQANGVELAIITGRTSKSVEARARNLGIDHVFQGVDDKARVFAELLAARSLAPEAAAFMGDDVLDLPVLEHCGLALTVPEAPLAVKRCADYVTRAPGGRGAVREACELVIHARGALARALQGNTR